MNSYYPLGLEWWMVGLMALALTAVGFWAFYHDSEPHSLGQAALPVSFVTAFGWLTDMPEWTAWAIVGMTTALWFVGMLMPVKRDDAWHFGALAVALFGKLAVWTLPWVWAVLTGKVTVPLVVLLLLIVLAIVGIIGLRSEPVRGGIRRTRNRLRRRRVSPA